MGDLSLHFNRHEFECQCGCGFNSVDAELIRVLESLRALMRGSRVTINSGCRCSEHNKAVDGSANSQHLQGKAADIRIEGVSPKDVADCLEDTYPDKYGIGRYNTFTHIDVRSDRARWGR